MTAPTAVAFEAAVRERSGRPWVVPATEPTQEAATVRMFALMDAHPGGGWPVRPARQTPVPDARQR